MHLSTLAILLGLGIGLPQIWGLVRPEEFGKALRKFPRSEVWGYPLMLLATAWFVWNLKQENISDFAAWKPFMLVGFGAVGVLACVFVRDFLPVRGLAILLLLLAKVALDVQRWADTNWKNVITVLAYVWVVAGVVLTVSPWWLRDWFHWLTATQNRVRIGCGLRLLFAVSLIVLGLTVYRADEKRHTGSQRLASLRNSGEETHYSEQIRSNSHFTGRSAPVLGRCNARHAHARHLPGVAGVSGIAVAEDGHTPVENETAGVSGSVRRSAGAKAAGRVRLDAALPLWGDHQ